MSIIKISGKEAWDNLRNNTSARWPKKENNFQTVITLPPNPSFRISRDAKIFCIGSCFARNIEEHLVDLGITVPSYDAVLSSEHGAYRRHNWVMINFSPKSMENELRWALDPEAHYPWKEALIEQNGKFFDPHLLPGIPATSLEQLQERRRILEKTYSKIVDCDIIIITLGLIEVWFDNATKLYLNATPSAKAVWRDPHRFSFKVLSFHEVFESLKNIYHLIMSYAKHNIKFIVSVSPIPLRNTFTQENVFIANMSSKSILRSAAAHICNKYQNVYYLPTYESIFMSNPFEIWEEDGRHVESEVVKKNVQILINSML